MRALLVMGSAASIAVSLALVADARAAASVVGVGFTLSCMAVVAWMALRRQRRHLFSPVVLVLTYLAVGVGARGLSNLWTHETHLAAVVDTTSATYSSLLVRVFALASLGVACFLVGYVAAGRRVEGRYSLPMPTFGRRGLLSATILGLAMSAVGAAALVSRLGLDALLRPGSVAVTGTVGLFWVYPLMFACVYVVGLHFAHRWAHRRAPGIGHVAGLIAGSATVFLLTSSKAAVFGAVLMLMVLRHYSVGAVRVRFLVSSVLFFMVSLPLLYAYRAYGLTLQSIQHGRDTILGGLGLFMGRSYIVDSFSAVLLYTPHVYPFKLGAPWLETFSLWIPRALWPDKPLSQSLTFGETYLASSSQAGSSYFAVSLLGDAYLNLGVAGIVLMFLALGFGLRRFYDWAVGSTPRPERLLIYAAAIYPITICTEQSLSVFVSSALSYVGVASVLAFVARRSG